MEFGQRLKDLRISSNTSQKELSERTGLSIRTIQRIENNDVKPSIYSLKTIGEFFKVDLSDFDRKTETKSYEFNLSIKITDMKQLMIDIKTLFRNNWKIILLIAIVIYFMSNYSEIKSGLIDGWNNK
jgi:transcriptional regulator with XRE-family HTH domain